MTFERYAPCDRCGQRGRTLLSTEVVGVVEDGLQVAKVLRCGACRAHFDRKEIERRAAAAGMSPLLYTFRQYVLAASGCRLEEADERPRQPITVPAEDRIA